MRKIASRKKKLSSHKIISPKKITSTVLRTRVGVFGAATPGVGPFGGQLQVESRQTRSSRSGLFTI